MAKGRKTTIVDMQMQVLANFDRELRNSGTRTSGLLRNLPVSQWKATPGLTKLSHADRRIAALKAELGID